LRVECPVLQLKHGKILYAPKPSSVWIPNKCWLMSLVAEAMLRVGMKLGLLLEPRCLVSRLSWESPVARSGSPNLVRGLTP